MRHLVIGQRQKAPNFSAFHWSPHGSLITIGQHFITTRVVHLPKRTEISLITESDQRRANHQLLQLCTVRTARLCGPCIAAKASFSLYQAVSQREDDDRQAEKKTIESTASTVGSCPTIIQISRTSITESYQSPPLLILVLMSY